MSKQQFVTEVGAQLGDGQTRCNPATKQFEWVGLCGGLETRVWWDETRWKALVKLTHGHGPATLDHEPGWSPKPGDAAPDESSDADTIRVCVAKEIFIETLGFALDDELRGLSGLPNELVEQITTAMPRDKVGGWGLLKAQMVANFLPTLDDGALVVHFTQLMAAACDQIQRLSPRAANGALPRVTCGHCTAMFMLTASARCPNCGAPATA